MSEPLISVIINTYNYGLFIEETIGSVLAQDYPADRVEILIVDDGSTDDTAARVKKFGNRVRYLYKQNGDYASAIVYGFQQSSGRLIALLDGDDFWLANKLSRVAREFQQNPFAQMVYHRYLYWDSRDGRMWDEAAVAEVSGEILSDRRKLLTYTPGPTSTLVFRRESFQKLSNVPLDRGFMFDIFLYAAVLFLGPVVCVPDVLMKYRVHGGNRWATGRDRPNEANLRRRIARRTISNEILRDWIFANAPKSMHPQGRILLERSQLIQDSEAFLLKPPSRLRLLRHHLRQIRIYGPVMAPSDLLYRWSYAFTEFVWGRHAHYLEGVRTRALALRERLRSNNARRHAGETAGRVS